MEIGDKKILIISAIVTTAIVIMAIFAFAETAMAPEDGFVKQSIWQKLTNTDKEAKKTDEPPTLPEAKDTEVTLIFGGDIMLSRQVNAKMEKYDNYNWPLMEIASITAEADITIANLESPFLKNASYQVPSGSFSFKANPKAVSALNLGGFDLLSLANNHMLNQGKQGIIDTQEILTENNIAFCGAGLNEEEAREAVIIERKGVKFAFLCYAYPEDNSLASETKAGIAGMNEEKMIIDIQNNKDLSDVVIAIMHAGTEYVTEPNWQQTEFARAAIDAGADIVIGHHPHWPQKFEFYQEKPIIYSLGNLIFDQMWSNETRQGLLLKMTWQNGLKELKFIPTKIDDYGQAKIMEDKEEISSLFKKIGAEDAVIFKQND